MNKILRISIVVSLLSMLMFAAQCNSDNSVTMSKQEYEELKGIKPTPPPEYPKIIDTPSGVVFGGYSMSLDEWKIILHDSCEYLYSYTAGGDGGPVYTHRGRCKFCKERLDTRFERLENLILSK